MRRWARAFYQPCLPLGEDGRRITGCKEHIDLSRKAATEGMVLLKNEKNILPFSYGTKIALFGKGSVDYVKGGGGSGDVTCAYVRSLLEGMEMKETEGKVRVYKPLGDFYRENVKKQYDEGVLPGKTQEPKVPALFLEEAKEWADVAVISICRYSRESFDRQGIPGDGDFYLTKEEQEMVDAVTKEFHQIVLVLNVGGMIDTSWFKDHPSIKGVLLMWQGGMEGGLAAADLLVGDENPSGKLTDTFAGSFDDYPSSLSYMESDDYVNYTEDIYVGYRYFETIPGADKKVNYPFGFGLSYTTFDINVCHFERKDDDISITVEVTNTGAYAGKEVIQLYYSAPQGLLGKPAKELGAYEKTKLLKPGETEELILKMNVFDMASYDDLGKVAKSAYVLEKGTYSFQVGNSVRNTVRLTDVLTFKEDRIVKQLSEKCPPIELPKRMLSDGSYELLEMRENYHPKNVLTPQDISTLNGIEPPSRFMDYKLRARDVKERREIFLEDVAEGKAELDDLLTQLSDRQLAELLSGQPCTGVANTYGMGNLPEHGIPNIMTADGPAGLRIQPQCGVYTTAFPCACMVACSFNKELAESISAAAALEVKENNMGIWLTPALNIHRSPLCGRNYEYYSEDPLVSGKTAAAVIRGIQSQGIGACAKHLCANNKEGNRKQSDSRVSERALREIYLKGFEILMKEAQPFMIMSSYNLLNGCKTAASKELLTDILREEWGFTGMVTTDWWNFGEHYMEVKAGGDIKMGCGYPDRLLEAMEKGVLSREEMTVCAKRILEMILRLE